ncbi:ABC transporter permease [Roseisolibacter sp. H3M3-2]|uniref:ABC transporter permease n=1 Tax=Roseisolibacter sp. H3M3-2 TaxID=3031323 RepID=UPI0023D99546|nr:ABC transporter permease [Roseisolibacter sp. H3M3-2]MDF1503288.1 ABC transporter permease [Roseisolibacter sp. H3M3-2]
MSGTAWWARAYDVALRAFPAHFRARWGDEMRLTLADRVAAARDRDGRLPLRLVARELASALAGGARERLHERLRHPATRPPMPRLQDVRYALRLLLRSPGFTLLTVLVLAGGIGLSTFTFSFLYTAMLRPVPLDEGARIVRVDPVVDGRLTGTDLADVAALAASVRSVRQLGAFTGRALVVGRDGDRRAIDGTVADPVLFAVARTPALLGRPLVPADAEPGAEPVLVLSYRIWQAAFGGDPGVVGRRVPLNGAETRVVGVMPEGFGFPVASEAWLPLPADAPGRATAGLASVRLVGRLAPGASHATAAAEVATVLRRAQAARDTSARAGVVDAAVETLPSAQIGEERALVFALLNLVAGLILLLALVNVTNLLLARADERVRETAVRLALGATAGRLVVQGMWETVLLCLAGGVVGTAGAAWGLEGITRWTQANIPDNLAFWWVWRLDHVTLLGAGAFVTVAIASLGAVAALRTRRLDVRAAMQDGGARGGARRAGRLSRALVAVQVTTVTVLMFFGVMAGVVAHRVVTIDPGFDPARLLQGGVLPPDARYPTAAARAGLYRDVRARVAEQGALGDVLLRRPLGEARTARGRLARRGAARTPELLPTAHVEASLGDLRTIGVEVLEGRALGAADDASRAPVAVVSRALARRHWGGRSPVGEQLRLAGAGAGDTATYRTVVGVVSDVPHGNPLARDRSADAIYVPLLQGDHDYAAVLARWRTTETAARLAMVQAFGAADPLLVPDGVQPFAESLRKMGLIAVSVTRLFTACFAFALVLALVGTYGLMSRAIGARTREIGLRRALGATDGRVARLILLQGGRQLVVGTLLAAPALGALGLLLRHYVPVSATLTVAAAVLVSASIVGLVLAASWVPTRRALRLTPRDALWTG